jgi:hypothetical protein
MKNVLSWRMVFTKTVLPIVIGKAIQWLTYYLARWRDPYRLDEGSTIFYL